MIVWCTGYRVGFPFFDRGFITAPANELRLYRRVFKPDIDNLFFIALLQAVGANDADRATQGRWIAAYLRREYHLAPVREIEDDIHRERERDVTSAEITSLNSSTYLGRFWRNLSLESLG